MASLPPGLPRTASLDQPLDLLAKRLFGFPGAISPIGTSRALLFAPGQASPLGIIPAVGPAPPSASSRELIVRPQSPASIRLGSGSLSARPGGIGTLGPISQPGTQAESGEPSDEIVVYYGLARRLTQVPATGRTIIDIPESAYMDSVVIVDRHGQVQSYEPIDTHTLAVEVPSVLAQVTPATGPPIEGMITSLNPDSVTLNSAEGNLTIKDYRSLAVLQRYTKQLLTESYLLQGIQWQAEYVILLDAGETMSLGSAKDFPSQAPHSSMFVSPVSQPRQRRPTIITFSVQAIITNNTGHNFQDVNLAVATGRVSFTPRPRRPSRARAASSEEAYSLESRAVGASASMALPAPEYKAAMSAGEASPTLPRDYSLYRIGRRNLTKELHAPILQLSDLPVVKRYYCQLSPDSSVELGFELEPSTLSAVIGQGASGVAVLPQGQLTVYSYDASQGKLGAFLYNTRIGEQAIDKPFIMKLGTTKLITADITLGQQVVKRSTSLGTLGTELVSSSDRPLVTGAGNQETAQTMIITIKAVISNYDNQDAVLVATLPSFLGVVQSINCKIDRYLDGEQQVFIAVAAGAKLTWQCTAQVGVTQGPSYF